MPTSREDDEGVHAYFEKEEGKGQPSELALRTPPELIVKADAFRPAIFRPPAFSSRFSKSADHPPISGAGGSRLLFDILCCH